MVSTDVKARTITDKKLFRIFASQQWLHASKVLEKAREQDIASSTVFRWLKKMTDEGFLEKDRKAYKDSQYRINPKKMPKELWEETVLKLEILNFIDENVRKEGVNRPASEILKNLAQWLGVLTLYSAFVAAKEGRESLMEIPAFYVTELGGAQAFVRRPLAHRVILELMKNGNLTDDEYFKILQKYQNPLLALGKEKDAQLALAVEKEELEKAFGKEKIEAIESIFKKVLEEGKSDFRLEREGNSQ